MTSASPTELEGRTVLLKRVDYGQPRWAKAIEYGKLLNYWTASHPAPSYMKERTAYLDWRVERDIFLRNND